MDDRALHGQHAQQADRASRASGLYIDAEPSVNARSLEIQTPEPGWKMEIYGATDAGRPTSGPATAWTKLADGTVEKRKQTFKLDTGDRRYRYYLVWITALPPDKDQVAITQLTLSRRPSALDAACCAL